VTHARGTTVDAGARADVVGARARERFLFCNDILRDAQRSARHSTTRERRDRRANGRANGRAKTHVRRERGGRRRPEGV